MGSLTGMAQGPELFGSKNRNAPFAGVPGLGGVAVRIRDEQPASPLGDGCNRLETDCPRHGFQLAARDGLSIDERLAGKAYGCAHGYGTAGSVRFVGLGQIPGRQHQGGMHLFEQTMFRGGDDIVTLGSVDQGLEVGRMNFPALVGCQAQRSRQFVQSVLFRRLYHEVIQHIVKGIQMGLISLS